MAQQNNYFTNMISRFQGNTDFILFLKPEQIQKSAKERIFREMSRGQIDYSEYGIYFQDSKFLENLIIAADDEVRFHDILCAGVNLLDLQCPGNRDVIRAKTQCSAKSYMYNVILSKLNECKYTGNVGVLTEIQYMLKDTIKIV